MIVDLVRHVLAGQSVASLIGDRAYLGVAPHEAIYPYLILDVTSMSPEYHLGGESGLVRSSVQVDCWANDSDVSDGVFEASRLATAVRQRLSGYRGLLDGRTRAASIILQSETSLDERPMDGSDYYRRRMSHQYQIVHEILVPDFTEA